MIPVNGYAAFEAKGPLRPFAFERRALKAHDVLIDIHYCGICHSDIHKVHGDWPHCTYPMVPGHEIVGVVHAIGVEVTRFHVGERVGVGCFVDSCRTCDACQDGLEQFCENGTTFTYNDKERDNSAPTQGGYSTQIVVDEQFVLRLPTQLPLPAMAPLLCAGITLYSPLMHWQAGPGKQVAIVGLGGLGHIGIKLAHAMGADVTVLSHSAAKEADARRLGATHFYATSDAAIFKRLTNQFDLIINTVSAKLHWNDYLGLLKRDGTMVIVGLPNERIEVDPFALVRGRHRLAGSLIGGIQETQAMLDFCGQHGITADIELIPMQAVNEAYARVLSSDVRYRFVIDMASLDPNHC